MNEIDTFYLFPTPVWKINILEELKKQNLSIKNIINECLKIKSEDKGRSISNQGKHAYQSNNLDFLKYKNTNLNQLMKTIDNISQTIYGTTWKGKINLSDTWLNINGPNSFNVFHNHPKGILSGCVYLKVPKDSGCLIMGKGQTDLFLYATYGDIKQDSEFTFETVSFEPKVGDVFIFPSHVEHSVGKNKSKKNRISLAFNYLKK